MFALGVLPIRPGYRFILIIKFLMAVNVDFTIIPWLMKSFPSERNITYQLRESKFHVLIQISICQSKIALL